MEHYSPVLCASHILGFFCVKGFSWKFWRILSLKNVFRKACLICRIKNLSKIDKSTYCFCMQFIRRMFIWTILWFFFSVVEIEPFNLSKKFLTCLPIPLYSTTTLICSIQRLRDDPLERVFISLDFATWPFNWTTTLLSHSVLEASFPAQRIWFSNKREIRQSMCNPCSRKNVQFTSTCSVNKQESVNWSLF